MEEQMYWLPIAAVTNDTQLLYYSSGEQKSNTDQQSCMSSGGIRRHLFSCLFQLLEVTCLPGLVTPSSAFQVHHSKLTSIVPHP